MKAHRGVRLTLALLATAAYGYATWLKISSSHESAGAWLVGVPVTLILILGLTYLRLRHIRNRRERREAEPPPH
jgi:predicted ABC-type exoprotein transport system permease subunit